MRGSPQETLPPHSANALDVYKSNISRLATVSSCPPILEELGGNTDYVPKGIQVRKVLTQILQ